MDKSNHSLPLELFDNVIDFLHDDPATLEACSLVCREWVSSSRYHLFRLITLSPPSHSLSEHSLTSCHRLYEVLVSSPRIASYIQELVISEGNISISWTSWEKFLPLLLRKLVNLQRLEIQAYPGSLALVNTWPEEQLSHLIQALSSISLRELKLHYTCFRHAGDLFHMIRACPHLKVIHLSYVPFPEAWEPINMGSAIGSGDLQIEQRSHVEMLTLASRIPPFLVDLCFLRPCSPVDLSNLRFLSIHLADHFVMFIKLLRAVPNLEHLEITLFPEGTRLSHSPRGPSISDSPDAVRFSEYWPLLEPIDFGLNPRLTMLALRVYLLLDRHDPLPWLHALFSTFQPLNSLEDISLVVTIDLPPPYLLLGVYQATLNGWKNLDQLLVQPQFLSLKRVRIDFELDNPIDDQILPQIIDEFAAQLAGLDRRGVLLVDSCEIR